jgi:alpha-maltose-1-phosphate synthase
MRRKRVRGVVWRPGAAGRGAHSMATKPALAGGNRAAFLLAFPSSNQNVRADAIALERAGMLSLFCTTIAWRRSRSLFGFLPPGIRRELERRRFDGIDPARISTFPALELVRLIASRLGLSALTRHEVGWASFDGVSRAFDRHVARLIRRGSVSASAVYAYEYAAKRTFEAAAERGMRRFYELPIGYWRAGVRIMTEERERNPEWALTMEALQDSAEKQEQKDAEIRAADHIIVPSDFVRATLREHPAVTATVDVIPYGAPMPRPSALAARSRGAKLRLLFVGHLSQRKGISYLFDAMRQLQSVATLTLVGPRVGGACPTLDGELKRHNWIAAVSHGQVLEIMSQHDIFVFPSLFEGLALVLLEAMAQGLPVVTTSNSGGSMVVDDGANGFVVPIRDPYAIVDAVLKLYNDRDRLASMSTAALRKAEEMSWAAREKALVALLHRRMVASDS